MIFEINGLKFAYNGKSVLNDLNFKINEGEMVAILGPNGSGKSTLLKCIDHILRPKEGKIVINNKQLSTYSRNDLAKEIAYVPQSEGTPFPSTVYDTVLLGRKPHIEWKPLTKDKEIVSSILDKLELTAFTLRKINQLSGGQRQKVYLGRALAQKTPMLLLDEPTANLDPKYQLEVMGLLKQQAEKGVSILIAIHDINLAIKYCDKIILLKEGKIHAHGGIEVITKKNLEEIYEIDLEILKHNGSIIVIPEKPINQIKKEAK